MPNSRPARAFSLRRPRLALAAAALVVGLALLTLAALEGNEVVTLNTQRADGSARSTRVWIAHDGQRLLIEAANGERDFLLDILRHPEIELLAADGTRRYHATLLPNPAGHELIRRLLREKYGWADVWIGFIADTSASIAVALEPS